MAFAKVVLGLPVEGPFDYLIPLELETKAKLGVRCSIPFRNKKMVGYIVDIKSRTDIPKVKTIYSIIDEIPLLSKEILTLTKEFAKYYFCSWGEAIETALPKGLRISNVISLKPLPQPEIKPPKNLKNRITLIHDLTDDSRWQIYLRKIKENIDANKGALFLTPQIHTAIEIQKKVSEKFRGDVALLHSKQDVNEGIGQWQKIRNNEAKIVVGTRLAVFAPVHNLGLIIVDNEADQSLKQDQTPHYHARDVAFMRAKLNKAELLLGSLSPSLETFYLAKKKKIKYFFIERKELPEIKIIDVTREDYYKRKRTFLSFQLQNILNSAILNEEKVVVFLNRKGFATCAICPNCRKIMRCERCDVNLVYHFEKNILLCHYCNYQAEVPKICPNCNSGYIRYLGIGTEKIESELSRLYPKAKILIVNNGNKNIPSDIDILISTTFIFRHPPLNFDLLAVVSIDNSLNRTDFRAAEKTFSQLLQLVALRPKRLIIQTSILSHYCFNAIRNLDIGLFYREELAFRKQTGFPPFSHLATVKLRGRIQDKVKSEAQSLLEKFNRLNKDKTIKIVSCFSGQPSKLRGNFYWQILVKSANVKKISRFLKNQLKGFSRSGIIVTVDVDPL